MAAFLIPLIAALAPMAASAIGSALGGAKGKDIATTAERAVSTAMQDTFGTAQPDEARRIAAADPDKAMQFRLQMETLSTQIAMAEIQARVSDMAGARSMGTQVPLIAKTQVALAGAITLMFASTLLLAAITDLQRVPDLMLGALIAAFSGVISFFMGNSTAGHSANNTLAGLAAKGAGVAPPGTPPSVFPPPTTDALNDAELQKIRQGNS